MGLIITTSNVFKIAYPTLVVPHQPGPDVKPKFSVLAMFPKTNIGNISGLEPTLDKLCDSQWKMSFAEATAPGMGINYPPSFKDGDLKYLKDANKKPIKGSIDPATAGMWLMSLKNSKPISVFDQKGFYVDPKSIYAGCWARARVECLAYQGTYGSVIALKLLSIQMVDK